MLYRRAAAAYKKVHMETSPARILDGLLARLLRDMSEAREAIGAKDFKKKSESIDHASRILSELVAALDRRQSPELCERLESLYNYAQERLLMASIKMDTALVDEAESVIVKLRGAFQEASGVVG